MVTWISSYKRPVNQITTLWQQIIYTGTKLEGLKSLRCVTGWLIENSRVAAYVCMCACVPVHFCAWSWCFFVGPLQLCACAASYPSTLLHAYQAAWLPCVMQIAGARTVTALSLLCAAFML